jgi:hypothetical protein
MAAIAPDTPMKGLELWACEWDDAHFNSEEFDRNDITHRPVKYVTVGILLKNDEVGMSFAADVCETGTFRGTNFVPRKMIIRAWKVGPLPPKQRRKIAEAPKAPPDPPPS